MTIRITEIVGRSDQGVTQPFLCRGDDGWLYYVKGNAAGCSSLVAEWLAGNIGQRFGLPIPAFKKATVPKKLIAFTARDDLMDLGSGICFASQQIENADELTYTFIEQIDPALRAKILLFDWWVTNGDRTLTEHGGNPNILWVHRDHKAYVIDHNVAFDETRPADFWSQHIFAASRAAWTNAFRQDCETLMKTTLKELERWWHEMPPEWTEPGSGHTLEAIKTLLWRFDTDPDTFWGVS